MCIMVDQKVLFSNYFIIETHNLHKVCVTIAPDLELSNIIMYY